MSSSSLPARSKRLSVAMIVRNAEDSLASSLKSIRDIAGKNIADEIVVLDTGSKDRTRIIAREHHVKVFYKTWDHDFSAARNYCLEKITSDWVLWLDAGETLSDKAATALRQAVDTELDDSKVYMMLVRVPPLGQSISGEQIAQIRLMPNRPELRFSGRIREQLQPAVLEAGMSVEALPWIIDRSDREHDPEIKAKKAQRDLQLAELEINENGPHTRLLFLIGEACCNLGLQEKAVESFRLAIAASEPASTEMLEAYYGLLTTCEVTDEDSFNAPVATCLEALKIFPLDAQLLCAMGGYLQAQKRFDLAAQTYKTAVDFGNIRPDIWHLCDLMQVNVMCLALTLRAQDKDDEARQVLEKALEQNDQEKDPPMSRVRRQLVELHIKHNRIDEALALVDQLPEETPHRDLLPQVVRGACHAASENWPEALEKLQAAYSSGCRDVLCLRWLTVTQLSTGQLEAAVPVLNEWQKQDPLNVEAQKYTADIADQLKQKHTQQVRTEEDGQRRQLRVDPAQEIIQPEPTEPKPEKSLSQNPSTDLPIRIDTTEETTQPEMPGPHVEKKLPKKLPEQPTSNS